MSPQPKPAWWGFWTHFPKKYWAPIDWECWEKAGRPKVPREMEIEIPAPPRPAPGNTPVIPPPGPKSAVTTLFPKPRRRDADARSDAVDRLIEKHVGR